MRKIRRVAVRLLQTIYSALNGIWITGAVQDTSKVSISEIESYEVGH